MRYRIPQYSLPNFLRLLTWVVECDTQCGNIEHNTKAAEILSNHLVLWLDHDSSIRAITHICLPKDSLRVSFLFSPLRVRLISVPEISIGAPYSLAQGEGRGFN
jgi:hypothetical protein